MFASLPHAVNFFSNSSAQYHIVAALLYFTVLQAVQSVQCTVGQKEFRQNSSMLHLMEAATNKTNLLILAQPVYRMRIVFSQIA